ncbi:TetR/AcrR family transcriptional regulator C-terminal domain-containing protein [Actinokineospora sp. NBRC 105648]|uniref:TetR/AcrR family transcriptional regulator n=1 Tax=Actinokineospora sp. NBRC 105648 TaxID=3032206 RepID=UPI0024A1D8C2|nr:TetR/AcrR family transcriptional regulator C-terminal domain-containing protein [Actinokineospora sp. NBRC 105648]GLZ43484.1 TetR family transcriptional regulator [Actinokineospora sp. NBRC 105648]
MDRAEMDDNRQADPERAVELLWGDQRETRLSLSRIVAAAVELADADGLAALSMRRIAERLGYTTMSLYRHVVGKAELVHLMRDAVFAELAPDADAGAVVAPARGLSADPADDPTADPAGGRTVAPAGWRTDLAAWARRQRALHQRHRWLVDSAGSRHVPGPNIMANYEQALAIAERTGLPPAVVLAVVDLVGGFVDSVARRERELAEAEEPTGESHDEWWAARTSLYERLGEYPALTRLWEAGGHDHPLDPFDFGLHRTLDGIEALIRDEIRVESRTAPCTTCGKPIQDTGRGRPRAYCSRACQQRAYRQRHP